MAQMNHCPQCGADLPTDAPEGLCPKCLMKVVQQNDVDATIEGSASIEGPGTRIGRYEMLELIGEGGMGLVYLAEQKEPVRRKVVLKIIKPGMDSKQVVARFEAERQALAVLDHPNIAHVFDAGTTETGRPYFVMEYVKGMSITRYCDEHKLSIEQRLRLFEQVCEGVHHAHQKGIIHRDLKPSNILVSVHGDRAVPKIIDFGIAKAITQPLTDKTCVTLQGQLLGTPQYMSPEQVDLATQDIDTRSDIYSLGVVLYELLAGVLPFESESFARAGLAEIQQTIREQEPASPSIRLTNLGEKAKTIAASRGTQVVPLARRLHRELEWIPLKAMRKDRCRRYKSASDMADDIRNYLDGNPLIAGPETAIYRVQKFVHKHAGSVATVALVAAAIVLGLIVSTAMYFRAEDARQKEAAARAQAEQATKKEAVARTEAEQAREKESIARVVAEQAEQATKQKAEELRRTLYANSIQLADAKYKEGNIRRVRELLASCPDDLRGWEWRRLNHIADQSLKNLAVLPGPINSLALSPDGKTVVSGGWGQTIKVCDMATGRRLMTIPRAHGGREIFCVAFSPDGKRIVSGDDNGEVNVWDVDSGKEVMKLEGPKSWTFSPAFSPDGKRIVSGGYDRDTGSITIKLWDALSGAELITIAQGGQAPGEFGESETAPYSLAFSPDGKRIVSGGKVTKVWDVNSGDEVMTLNGGSPVLYSPDSKFIVSCKDNEIKILDATTGSEMMTLRGHDGPIDSIAFSPDSKYIISGGMDNMIKVWDVASGRELRTLRGHEGFVTSVAFTSDGMQIVSGSWDGTIKLWDVASRREQTRLLGHEGVVASIAFSPDGKRIVSRSDNGEVKVWDVASATDVMTLRGGRGLSICSTAFSPDGKRIASLSEDLAAIKVWDAESGSEVMTLRGHKGPVESVTLSPDGRNIASGGGRQDKTIKVWDAISGKEIMTLKGHADEVACLAFSPDGKRLVSGSWDGIRVWDLTTGAQRLSLPKHGYAVTSVSFSPDGKRIASASHGETAKIWDATTGNELMTLKGHGDIVLSVAFSPDGKRLISGSRDRTVSVLDVETGAELLTLPTQSGVPSVAFSPDGKTIATGTFGNTIVLWESAAPEGGYEPQQNAEAARKAIDELPQRRGLYGVIEGITAHVLNGQSWRVVRLPDGNEAAYRKALSKAQKAVGLRPDDWTILDTLGGAQYRVGAYEDALETLARSERIRLALYDDPCWDNLAFAAMALHRLGRADEAKATLQQLRALLKDDRFADHEEAKALLAEAEKLLAGGNGQRK